jgi:hypothetical protein
MGIQLPEETCTTPMIVMSLRVMPFDPMRHTWLPSEISLAAACKQSRVRSHYEQKYSTAHLKKPVDGTADMSNKPWVRQLAGERCADRPTSTCPK